MIQDTAHDAPQARQRSRRRWYAPRLGALLVAALLALTLASLAARPSQTNTRASHAAPASSVVNTQAAPGATDLGAAQFPLAPTPTTIQVPGATPPATTTSTSSSTPG